MNYRQREGIIRMGPPVAEASGAVVLLHGRGSSGHGMTQLVDVLDVRGSVFLAPSGEFGAWYPKRFLEPVEANEPALSDALSMVGELVSEIEEAGVPASRIGLLGFSQGACLAAEYLSRNPRRMGFVGVLSGALIGPLESDHGGGNLEKTPVLLGCAESDAHIPLEYVEKSAAALGERGAEVTKIIFPGDGHTVYQEEIDWLKERLAQWE